MSDYPSQQSSGSQSYDNPLPYPDRRRPGQQGYNPPPSESTPHAPTGALPYPNRPAKYSDYAKPSSPSQPQYQSDSSGYKPPPEKQEVKPVAAQPQKKPGAWPTPPTEYNDHEDDPRPGVASGYSKLWWKCKSKSTRLRFDVYLCNGRCGRRFASKIFLTTPTSDSIFLSTNLPKFYLLSIIPSTCSWKGITLRSLAACNYYRSTSGIRVSHCTRKCPLRWQTIGISTCANCCHRSCCW